MTVSRSALQFDVTVAICTWNRADLLRRTLDQMTRLTLPGALRWEILIVDNNCTDHTNVVLDEFAHRLPLRAIREMQPGLSRARNRVLREARGALILWTDDDVLVDSSWLAAFVDAAREYPDAAGFGGPIEPWFLEPPDPDLIAAFPSLAAGYCGLGEGIKAGPIPATVPVWGANMAFRRSAIEGLLFDTGLGASPTFVAGGEEVDFIRRLRARGGVIVWCPHMRVRHCVPPSRATLEYLTKYTFGKGSEHVVLDSVASSGGRSLFGVPRWLWRDWAAARVREWMMHRGLALPMSRLRSGPAPTVGASRRTKRLVAIRERCFIDGMLEACRSGRVAAANGTAPTIGRRQPPTVQA